MGSTGGTGRSALHAQAFGGQAYVSGNARHDRSALRVLHKDLHYLVEQTSKYG